MRRYGRTHQDHFSEYFAGWNISTRRVLSDYSLSIDGQPLLRAEAGSTTVAPDGIVRQWPQAKEQMRLIDNDDLIYDHLNSDGRPDKQYRPNQLFCFELIGDEAFKKAVTIKA